MLVGGYKESSVLRRGSDRAEMDTKPESNGEAGDGQAAVVIAAVRDGKASRRSSLFFTMAIG